jgi:hypothetical protein
MNLRSEAFPISLSNEFVWREGYTLRVEGSRRTVRWERISLTNKNPTSIKEGSWFWGSAREKWVRVTQT